MKRFFLCGGRCPRRKLDAQKIINYFMANGWNSTRDYSKADLAIVYTCGSFDYSEDESVNTIKKIFRKNTNLIVTGCMIKISPDRIDPNVIIIPQEELGKLDRIIDANVKFKDISDVNTVNNIPGLFGENLIKKLSRHFQFRKSFINEGAGYLMRKFNFRRSNEYNIMISRGCLGECSYCVIKKAQGKLKSKPVKEVLREFDEGLKKGYRDFVLRGEDTGCYGMDIKTDIVSLLRKIFSYKKEFNIVIDDFNPQWLCRYNEELISVFMENQDRIKRIVIPVQSGSKRILGAMKRPYKIDSVRDILMEIRKKIPGLKIETHALVGFPGESWEDFNETRKFLREIGFSRIFIYRYADREGTEAYKLEGKLSRWVIFKRALLLGIVR